MTLNKTLPAILYLITYGRRDEDGAVGTLTTVLSEKSPAAWIEFGMVIIFAMEVHTLHAIYCGHTQTWEGTQLIEPIIDPQPEKEKADA